MPDGNRVDRSTSNAGHDGAGTPEETNATEASPWFARRPRRPAAVAEPRRAECLARVIGSPVTLFGRRALPIQRAGRRLTSESRRGVVSRSILKPAVAAMVSADAGFRLFGEAAVPPRCPVGGF
jgi:hypothetical protein